MRADRYLFDVGRSALMAIYTDNALCGNLVSFENMFRAELCSHKTRTRYFRSARFREAVLRHRTLSVVSGRGKEGAPNSPYHLFSQCMFAATPPARLIARGWWLSTAFSTAKANYRSCLEIWPQGQDRFVAVDYYEGSIRFSFSIWDRRLNPLS